VSLMRLAGAVACLAVLALAAARCTGPAEGPPAEVRASREALLEKARLNPVRVVILVKVPAWAKPKLWPTDEQWKALYAAKQRVVDRVAPLGATDIRDGGPEHLSVRVPLPALQELLAHPDVQSVLEQVDDELAGRRS
jgi:hypothetical protein